MPAQNNIQKLVVFLCTNNQLSEKEVKKTISFTVATENIHLGTRFAKEVKYLSTKNMKLMKDDINGKISHVYGLEELILFVHTKSNLWIN